MLSVIVPTRNRAALLEKALRSLLAQTLSPLDFEVIVIDNGSTDNTVDVVGLMRKIQGNLHYFKEPRPGLHAGRHKGFVEAHSNLLVYADDDIEAFPTWLEAIRNSFKDEDVVMVGGKCLPKFEAEPPEWLNAMWSPNAAGERILGYLSVIDLGDDTKPVNPYYVFGCNFAIRRSILFEAGGFHPDGMPQELIHFRGDGESYVANYIQSKGYKALYNPLASIYHWAPESRMTTEYFCRRAYNQGISDSYTTIRHAKGIGETVTASTITDFCQWLRNKSVSGILGAVSRITGCLALNIKGDGSTAGEEAAGLRRSLVAAYKTGYAHHQAHVRQSPELLAWVLRPDYWDCQLPSPGNFAHMGDI
jgi:glucosyl-dolichyl phosphate glucuronosyltransferase